MKKILIQEAFELELNVLQNDLEKPTSNDTEYWVNQGILKFIKTRYTGNNYWRKGFEQSLKRVDDLRTLVTTLNLSVTENMVTLPEDYMYMLGDRAGILPIGEDDKCWKKDGSGNYIVRFTDTLEATVDNIDRQLENSLSEHHLHYCAARPLKLIQGNNIEFYTDENYYVSNYKLTYLRKPEKFTIEDPYSEYTELTDEALHECIKYAVQMYLESKGSLRYNSISNEIKEME